MRAHPVPIIVVSTLLLAAIAGCNCGAGSGTDDGGTSTDGSVFPVIPPVDGGTGDGGTGSDAGVGSDGGTGTDGGGPGSDAGLLGCYQVTCAGHLYQCANCIDDDNDGLIDAADPDCFGPCHNDERSFDIGIQAAKGGNCDSLECYYDTNAGRGNDDCYSSFRC